jgi:dolichol-phosphate mannosyltransferase
VKGVSLSRNVGHQAALACGLAAATGDVVVSVDADLQHPPSFIPKMIAAWREGYDVVNTIRRRTETEGKLDAIFSKIFYRLFNRISSVKLTPDSPDFRLLDRCAVDALNQMPEHLKFFRGMVPYIGFSQTTLTFDCPPRFAGQRSYTLRKSLKLAYDGILSFSDIGLKLPFLVGLVVMAVALIYLVGVAILVLNHATPLVQGWASLMSVSLLTLGLNLTFVGMFGLYLGKIFVEVKRRPLYFVKNTVGIGKASAKTDPLQSPYSGTGGTP